MGFVDSFVEVRLFTDRQVEGTEVTVETPGATLTFTAPTELGGAVLLHLQRRA